MAHTRIFTRLILILMCSFYSYIFGFNCGLPDPDGGQSYLAALITLHKKIAQNYVFILYQEPYIFKSG